MMDLLARRSPIDVPAGRRRQLRAALAALGLSLGGFGAGIVGIFATSSAVAAAGIGDTAAVRLLSGNYIQVGFAAFAAVFLFTRSNRERFFKLRRPTLEDAAWIAVIPLVLVASSLLVEPAMAALGLPEPTPGGGAEIELADRLGLWPVALVGLYLFAAPAEEVVYRGLIQGRLRGAFGTVGVVVVSGVLFALLHLLSGLLTPSVSVAGSLNWGISTLMGGLLWGYAYERTGNLLVTSVTHAMMWTVPFHDLLPFL